MISSSKRRVLLGLIGSDIQQSLSPDMHESEGDAHGLRVLYQRIDLARPGLSTDDLPELLRAAQSMGFSGLNITHPCKQRIIPHLDQLSADARDLGAVNTVVFDNGKSIGHNTDWWGFAESFKRGLPGASLIQVVQLGAGGAGAAVAHAALTLGVGTLNIFDVDPKRAASLAAELGIRFGTGRAIASTDLPNAMRAANGLIHATPTGMTNYPGLPLPAELLHADLWVADIVYFPLQTELLRTAEGKGCRTLHGGGMAVFQAVEAFRLFTGVTPDSERMLGHFEKLQAMAALIQPQIKLSNGS
jgi:shikimate dehydrogenase